MDNAQKAIMIGVGLFITIIIISAVLLIVNLGTGLVDDATDNLSSISSTLQNSILQNYDNKIVSGTQVRSALQQYMTSDSVSVVLADDKGNLIAGIGKYDMSYDELSLDSGLVTSASYKNTATTIKTISNFTNVDRSSTMFVPTSKQYESYIIYYKDAMVGILFIPEARSGNFDGLKPNTNSSTNN